MRCWAPRARCRPPTPRSRGGTGVGVTLSSAQAAACRWHGLDVHLYDARRVTRDSFGAFDAVASPGAFEHFCSPEEHGAGRQETLYREVFARVTSLLPDGGRFYLQTMVFGRRAADRRLRPTALPPRLQHQRPLEYIDTIRQWRRRFAAPSPRKTLLKIQLLPRWLTNADFRLAFTSGVSADSACFERELPDHHRLVFEKHG